ncbi:hypothetical protein KKC88_02160 [Patescibacteria group bacterium]|nr:hypothetical protein [Patescibacteria group bacterium]MBU1673111.1 hypothetical protein [Patescibacteria group bacterium]MBU1963789.1 hypothetical protein [Patescibacteria group bacterium]
MITKQCKQCQKTFKHSDEDLEYFERIGIPPNDLCFRCTKIKQLCWRNERVFYPRKCDCCQGDMVSCFPPDAKHPVYCNDCWWSDKFDPLKYGQEYTFNKPFFKQIEELINKTPVGNLFIDNSENSKYTNLATNNKDCYMVTASDYCENLAYASYSSYDKDSIDLTEVNNSELCYEGIDLERCYQCQYCQFVRNCNDCYFCYDLNGCQDCLGCVNLRNQKYSIFNKQYSEEDYKKKFKEFALHTNKGVAKFKKLFKEFKDKQFYMYSHNVNIENSTGDYLINTNNCRNCYNLLDCENCTNSIHGDKSKDCMDAMGLTNTELTYNSIACPGNNNSQFCAVVWPGSSNNKYIYLCRTANDCFGCVSLHKHQYCILNKQYTEEEYNKMVPKIIEHMKKTGEWGQFFPMEISPWAYNETVGQDMFPLSKEQAKVFGARWQENLPYTTNKETMSLDEIPDDIKEVDFNKLENAILACEECERNYKLVKQELDFYKNMSVPIPRRCPDCRHFSRMRSRNLMELWKRRCDCTIPTHDHDGRCTREFETTYNPNRKELIYCEKCFSKEVY